MAYMSQDKKKQIAEKLKIALKGSGLKYSLGVNHHSTLVMNIKSGPVDFLKNYVDTVRQTPRVQSMPHLFQEPTGYMQINDYHYHDQFSGKALDLLKKIIPVLNDGNHDNSDMQSDYFDVGWYLSVNIGKYNKPYEVTK